MSHGRTYCAECAKKIKEDPKFLIIPAKFYPSDRIPPMDDVGLLREIIFLDTSMEHRLASYDIPHDPEVYNDTYKSVRETRERIEENIRNDENSYKIIDFGKIYALTKPEHKNLIQSIITEVREDYFAEDRFFGKKVSFHDNVMYGVKKAKHDCWIFLLEDFILFTEENVNQIKKFFLLK